MDSIYKFFSLLEPWNIPFEVVMPLLSSPSAVFRALNMRYLYFTTWILISFQNPCIQVLVNMEISILHHCASWHHGWIFKNALTFTSWSDPALRCFFPSTKRISINEIFLRNWVNRKQFFTRSQHKDILSRNKMCIREAEGTNGTNKHGIATRCNRNRWHFKRAAKGLDYWLNSTNKIHL